MPPKTWQECLELAREFIKDKRLDAKWKCSETPKGRHLDNDPCNQHKRSIPRYGRRDTRNDEHAEAQNNVIKTLSKSLVDIRISEKVSNT